MDSTSNVMISVFNLFKHQVLPAVKKKKKSTLSLSDEGNPAEEEPNYQGKKDRDLFSGGEQRRPKSPEGRAGQRDRQMEERETKAWSMLSKLQENTPQQSSSSRSRSNFEDCEFGSLLPLKMQREKSLAQTARKHSIRRCFIRALLSFLSPFMNKCRFSL